MSTRNSLPFCTRYLPGVQLIFQFSDEASQRLSRGRISMTDVEWFNQCACPSINTAGKSPFKISRGMSSMILESPVTCPRFALITRSELFLIEKYTWACHLSLHGIPTRWKVHSPGDRKSCPLLSNPFRRDHLVRPRAHAAKLISNLLWIGHDRTNFAKY